MKSSAFRTIRGKLIAGFALIILLISLLGGISSIGMRNTIHQYHQVIDMNLPVSTYVWQIRSNNLEQVAAVRAYMLYQDEKFPKLFNDIHKHNEAIFDEVSELLETEKSREYLSRIKEINNQYALVAQDVFELVKKGELEEATRLGEEGREQVEKMKETTQAWLEWVDEVNHGIVIDTKRLAQNRELLTYFIIAFAAMMSLIIAFLMNGIIAKPISKVSKALLEVSSGNLKIDRVNIRNKDEVGVLADSLNKMIDDLRETLEKVNDASAQVASSAQQLSASAEQSAEATNQMAGLSIEAAAGADNQLKGVNESFAIVQQLTVGIQQINDSVQTMSHVAQRTANVSLEGNATVTTVANEMKSIHGAVKETAAIIKELDRSSERIDNMVQVITGISEQTNLLALNAAIEAARAGEQGKGFAVVAEEVRKLAEQSKDSTLEIKTTIADIQKGTEQAVEAMNIVIEKVNNNTAGKPDFHNN
ncbi:methyl-accepting chemotaxis protein [Alkaliphilus hydrothermalis]|uniref:Methyl-accepting chemotaxis protein n=1 Tax=Alkaliphilus hydrothermalis TaxID=1482730 RepID=A0ABS2NTY5_9FIRM|nr:methyl-accepting chemotaxis protein [Alkaliphilus hydrothermalis]MBM7616418.1 methyl-accepting chemotaxis protein [Alkaliphilus hydrothermalis]